MVTADYYSLDIRGVSKILLCSDGLTNEVSEEDIFRVLQGYNGNQCMELINMSKKNGGRDNISIIIFKGEWECR